MHGREVICNIDYSSSFVSMKLIVKLKTIKFAYINVALD